jgi:hypothetical protein
MISRVDHKRDFDRLNEAASSINLHRLGGIFTTDTYLFDRNVDVLGKVDRYIQSIIAYPAIYAKGRLIGQKEEEIGIRDLSPSQDLCHGRWELQLHFQNDEYDFASRHMREDQKIITNQWVQDYDLFMAMAEEKMEPYNDHYVFTIYSNTLDQKIDQKVIIIYGLEFLNGFRQTLADRIEFWREGIKIELATEIDNSLKFNNKWYQEFNEKVEDINMTSGYRTAPVRMFDKFDNNIEGQTQGLKGNGLMTSDLWHPPRYIYHNQLMFFKVPLLWKTNENMSIKFHVPVSRMKTAEKHIDEIKIKGFVADHIERIFW